MPFKRIPPLQDEVSSWTPGDASDKSKEVRQPEGIGKWDPNDSSQETRIIDPNTGGEKGSKLAQLGAIEPRALMELAKVAGYGGEKYARYNFLKGYKWSLSYDALQRHAHAFWAGEDFDPESKLYHLAHLSWHGLALLSFSIFKLGTDDRPFKEN